MYYTIAGRDLEREVVPLAEGSEPRHFAVEPARGRLSSPENTRARGAPTDGSRPHRVRLSRRVDKEKAYDVIDVMKEIGDARGVSVAQIALSWLLHQKHVTSVIIGAKTEAQLNDNLAATSVELSSNDLKRSG